MKYFEFNENIDKQIVCNKEYFVNVKNDKGQRWVMSETYLPLSINDHVNSRNCILTNEPESAIQVFLTQVIVNILLFSPNMVLDNVSRWKITSDDANLYFHYKINANETITIPQLVPKEVNWQFTCGIINDKPVPILKLILKKNG